MLELPVWNIEGSNDYQPVSPRQALRVAINLKALIDILIPVAVSDNNIKNFSLNLPKEKTLNAFFEAAGGEGTGPQSSARRYQACLIFCLLKVSGWYETLASDELVNNELYSSRSLFAQKIACIIIDRETEDKYLFISMLCHRYSINLNDEDSEPANALELAVDTHSLIISTSGYQRCIKWLWIGWIVQSESDPSEYVLYDKKTNTNYLSHFSPSRIQTPFYQNILEIGVAILYLIIYTIVANIESNSQAFNIPETILNLFTLGFALDEFQRFYHLGPSYVSFPNIFNDLLYGIMFISTIFRFFCVYSKNPAHQDMYNITSQRFIAVAAPFMWIRMFFFCDLYQFFGVMIVIIKMMLKESIFFFVLLSVVIIGFLQAFIGLDQADGKRDLTYLIITNMLQTVLSGPDFSSIERFAYPYGSILYYIYNFLVSVMLLNILIALFSQAYADVIDNANQEYLHQFATRVLKYIRAPDAKIFFPPLNLIEIFLLDIPFFWWMNEKTYNTICNQIMIILYAPALLFIANYETKLARRVEFNRTLGLTDDANEENREWILTDGYEDDMNSSANMDLIRRSVLAQHDAESSEPEFTAKFLEWNKKINTLVPPVDEATRHGVSVEGYEILQHIKNLTEKVDLLIKQNDQLKNELKQRK